MKKNSSEDPTDEQILKFLFTRADFEYDCEPLGPARYEVERQLVPIVCWKCYQALAAVRGYRCEDVFIALADLSDTRTVTAFVAELRTQAPGISRFPTATARPPAGSISRLNAPGAASSLASFS